MIKLLLALQMLLTPVAHAAETVTMIVHSGVTDTELTTADISDYFLKKKRNWPDGTAVRFIDHQDDTAERKLFLKSVMKQSSREIDQFWIAQKLATGNSAPLQVATDALTASLVSRFPGAIGYVSNGFTLPSGVKKITVTGGQQ